MFPIIYKFERLYTGRDFCLIVRRFNFNTGLAAISVGICCSNRYCIKPAFSFSRPLRPQTQFDQTGLTVYGIDIEILNGISISICFRRLTAFHFNTKRDLSTAIVEGISLYGDGMEFMVGRPQYRHIRDRADARSLGIINGYQ